MNKKIIGRKTEFTKEEENEKSEEKKNLMT